VPLGWFLPGLQADTREETTWRVGLGPIYYFIHLLLPLGLQAYLYPRVGEDEIYKIIVGLRRPMAVSW